MTSPRDPYEVLGIRFDASSAEISRAYRRIARDLHPDSCPAAPDAADQFRAATAAYELLSDPDRRAAHGPGAGQDTSAWRPGYPSRSPVMPSPSAAVRPGPVRIEPLPGPGPGPGPAPGPGADAATRLAELLLLIRQQARHRRYRTW